MSTAKGRLELGARYPYDAPDSWWKDAGVAAPPAADWAHYAARGILADLTDRRGIKYSFDNIDDDVRAEMVTTMAEIIRAAAREAGAEDELETVRGQLDAARMRAERAEAQTAAYRTELDGLLRKIAEQSRMPPSTKAPTTQEAGKP